MRNVERVFLREIRQRKKPLQRYMTDGLTCVVDLASTGDNKVFRCDLVFKFIFMYYDILQVILVGGNGSTDVLYLRIFPCEEFESCNGWLVMGCTPHMETIPNLFLLCCLHVCFVRCFDLDSAEQGFWQTTTTAAREVLGRRLSHPQPLAEVRLRVPLRCWRAATPLLVVGVFVSATKQVSPCVWFGTVSFFWLLLLMRPTDQCSAPDA